MAGIAFVNLHVMTVVTICLHVYVRLFLMLTVTLLTGNVFGVFLAELLRLVRVHRTPVYVGKNPAARGFLRQILIASMARQTGFVGNFRLLQPCRLRRLGIDAFMSRHQITLVLVARNTRHGLLARMYACHSTCDLIVFHRRLMTRLAR